MSVTKLKGVAIIAPKGWLMGGDETDKLEKSVMDSLAAGNRCLVLDLIGTDHMNSTALGKFALFHKLYADQGGRVVLCNVDRRIQSILVITHLTEIFDVYESEREAVASFEGRECPE